MQIVKLALAALISNTIKRALAILGFKKQHISVIRENPIESYATEAWLLFGSPLNSKHLIKTDTLQIHHGHSAPVRAKAAAAQAIRNSVASIKDTGGLTFSDIQEDTPYQKGLSNLVLEECGKITLSALSKAQRQSEGQEC